MAISVYISTIFFLSSALAEPSIIFSRSFPWIYKDDLKTGKAQALQRYSLVAHLAPEITHGVMGVFARLHETGNTIILVTHEADIAAYAHRVISIRDGQVEKDTRQVAEAAVAQH